MHICIKCDIIDDMSDLEDPQCYRCGSTMYPINPPNKRKRNEHYKKYYTSLKI